MDYRWVRKAVARGETVNAEILSLDGVIYLALINDEPLKKRDGDGQADPSPAPMRQGAPSTPWVFERACSATTPPMTR